MSRATKLCVGQRPQNVGPKAKARERSPPPMKRLRLRGDWSDTGPNARPDNGKILNQIVYYENTELLVQKKFNCVIMEFQKVSFELFRND